MDLEKSENMLTMSKSQLQDQLSRLDNDFKSVVDELTIVRARMLQVRETLVGEKKMSLERCVAEKDQERERALAAARESHNGQSSIVDRQCDELMGEKNILEQRIGAISWRFVTC